MDRNLVIHLYTVRIPKSLSARRAWIEIAGAGIVGNTDVSLSARRAWIEITFCMALLAVADGRSPQGERG